MEQTSEFTYVVYRSEAWETLVSLGWITLFVASNGWARMIKHKYTDLEGLGS